MKFEKAKLQKYSELTKGRVLRRGRLDGGSYDSKVEVSPSQVEMANLITSTCDEGAELHLPVLDFDLPIHVQKSSNGNNHLYINKKITWDKYVKVMEAMADAGILEEGYVNASKSRGYSAVRPPWVKKGTLIPIASSEDITTFPFPVHLVLWKDEDGLRELSLESSSSQYPFSQRLTDVEFIAHQAGAFYTEDPREVWIRDSVYTSKTVEFLLDKGYITPKDSTNYVEDIGTFRLYHIEDKTFPNIPLYDLPKEIPFPPF